MSRVRSFPSRCCFVRPVVAAVPLVLAGFVGNASAADNEKNIVVPVSAYEKILSRMEQMEAELKSLKSKQVKQAKQQKKLEEQSASPQVVVVDRAAEVPNAASDSSYIPTRHHGGVYPSGGLKDDIDKPVTARLGAFYGEAGVTVLKLFGERETAFVVDDEPANRTDHTTARTFEHKFASGGRYEVGYRSSRGLGLAARYWNYKTEAEVSAIDPNGGSVEFYAVFFDDPDLDINTGDGDRLDVKRTLSFRTMDVEATSTSVLANGFRAAFTAGMRFADIKMGGDWTDTDDDGSFDESISVSNDFRGAGPVIGASFSAPLYHGGALRFNAFGLARGSLLYGQSSLDVIGMDSTTSDPFVNTLNVENNKVVATGELQLGLEAIWSFSRSTPFELFAKGHLEAQYWGGVGTVAVSEADSASGYESDFLVDASQGMYGGTFMVGVRTPLGQ